MKMPRQIARSSERSFDYGAKAQIIGAQSQEFLFGAS
jgi:hypothetical protein